jgi:serine/threonine-protein kinase
MAASALNHPNIITIYEVNSEGNTDFIVMEYVRGRLVPARSGRSGSL